MVTAVGIDIDKDEIEKAGHRHADTCTEEPPLPEAGNHQHDKKHIIQGL